MEIKISWHDFYTMTACFLMVMYFSVLYIIKLLYGFVQSNLGVILHKICTCKQIKLSSKKEKGSKLLMQDLTWFVSGNIVIGQNIWKNLVSDIKASNNVVWTGH